MMNEFVGKLENFLTANNYINLHSKEFYKRLKDRKKMTLFLSQLGKTYGNTLISLDVKRFHSCDGEEEEAEVALDIINQTLKSNGINEISSTISITEVLKKLSQKIDQRTLVTFYLFSDIYDEREKDILRSIRKFIEIFEKSFFLNILIVSHKPVHNWELYPESNLDDRHVGFMEY